MRPKIDISLGGGKYTSLGYRSAEVAAREGRSYSISSGEAMARYDRIKMVNQSRDFMVNNGIYKGMIERATNYIVSNGFILQSKAKDPETRNLIESLWRNFWRRPEIKNLLSGRKVEKMICRELLSVGDIGIIKVNNGKIQLIESEQITGKKGYTDDGIQRDSFGTPSSFSVGGYGVSGQIDRRTIRSYTPEQFLFITDPERPSSLRGVPPCQASFPMLHRINDVCDSEAIAWQLLARMAVSITREDGGQLGYNESKADPDLKDTDGKLSTRLTEIDYALIFHGQPGEKVEGIERNIPGQNFSQSLYMFLRLLGLPLGLPLEIILLDWTKSNYSQSRAVLEQAFQTFLGWQFMLEDFAMRPIFEWQIKRWVREGKIKNTLDIYEHDWIKPSFPWIDQQKEIEAWGQKMDRSLVTHQQACKSLNSDREDVVSAKENEVRDAINRAGKIKKDTGITVPWQIFCGLEVPSVSVKEPVDDEEKNKGNNTDE